MLEADALAFASHWHQGQVRKGRHHEPFLQHPMRVAYRLQRHGLNDPVLIQAALLHDVLEDTACPPRLMEERFGAEVLSLVQEVTDNKEHLKLLRKQTQVERAPLLSLKAKLIRLADKIDNLSGLQEDPPQGWSILRQREYVTWSRRVVKGIRGTHPGLEQEFDEIAEAVWTSLTQPCG